MSLKKFLMVSGLSMVLVLGACGNGGEDGSDETVTETEEDSSASSSDANAEDIARDSYASCHGSDFSGGMGPALAGLSLSEDEFSEIVRNGQGSMPAFSEEQINDEELSALHTYFSEQ